MWIWFVLYSVVPIVLAGLGGVAGLGPQPQRPRTSPSTSTTSGPDHRPRRRSPSSPRVVWALVVRDITRRHTQLTGETPVPMRLFVVRHVKAGEPLQVAAAPTTSRPASKHRAAPGRSPSPTASNRERGGADLVAVRCAACSRSSRSPTGSRLKVEVDDRLAEGSALEDVARPRRRGRPTAPCSAATATSSPS